MHIKRLATVSGALLFAGCGPHAATSVQPTKPPVTRLTPRDRTALLERSKFQLASSAMLITGGGSGLSPGLGYDSLTASPVVGAPCVVWDGEISQPGNGQQATAFFHKTTNAEDLFQSLALNGSVSLGIGMFSGSGAISYASEAHTSRYSVNLIQTLEVDNAIRTLRKPRLTPRARTLMRNKQWPQFYRECGDYFAWGYKTGGLLQVVLAAQTDNATTRQQMDAAMSAGYGFLSLSADTQSKLQSYKDSQQLSLQIVRQGPAKDLPSTDIQDLEKYFEHFPVEVAPDPHDPTKQGPNTWTISYTLAPYTALIDQPLDPGDAYAKIFSQWLQVRQRTQDWQYVQDYAKDFAFYDPVRVANYLRALSDDRKTLEGAASECAHADVHKELDNLPCDSPKLNDLPPEPPDAPAWQPLEPKNSGWQLVDTSPNDSTRTYYFMAQGSWTRGPGWPTQPVGQGNAYSSELVRFHNLTTNAVTSGTYTNIIPVPANTQVFFLFNDVDNWSDNDGKVSGAVFVPTFPFNASKGALRSAPAKHGHR